MRSVSAAIRDERATTQTDPFQANPEGPWRFGRFSALLAPYVSIENTLVDTASPARTALKIGQIAGGGMPPTYETMHWFSNANRIKIEAVKPSKSTLKIDLKFD